MRQISKTYGALRANDSINFSVRPGTIHAIAGENGAGKSTLMKILFGLIEPDDSSSEIFINDKKMKFFSPLDAIAADIGMVQQHFALAGPLSALDNIILGDEPTNGGFIDRAQAQLILEALAGEQLSVPWHKPAEDLSVGLQQRLEILKLLFRKASILILDEPTAVLTPQEVETFFSLLRRLKSEGKTIIIITHKLHEILTLCDDVTVLRHGRVTGSFSVKGLTKEKLIQAMIGREISLLQKKRTQLGAHLVEIKGISLHEKTVGSLNDLSLTLSHGEIVGIAGVEGNGQQALVASLLGLGSYEGTIFYKQKPLPKVTAEIRNKLNFGLISEDRQTQSLWLDASVSDNCSIGFTNKFSRYGLLNGKGMKTHAEEALSHYEVKMSGVGQKVKSLSGGNQQKIVVAREVNARKPEFLIASQPTRGVDVGAIEFIHQQLLKLQESGAAILLISSELEELCALSDRIVVFFEGRNVAEFSGPKYDLQKIGMAMTGGVNHA
ncbi:MAG: ABC transporter ATP-binding protein [Oligoflexia bacterium]|nr:ABC transporter ATP-binding protein [Oligoflexia bacterium]